MATNQGNWNSSLNQLENLLAEYLHKKAPALPTGVKEAIVKFAPWITAILLILTLPVLLAILGLGALLAPFSFFGGIQAGTNYIVTLVFSGIQLVLEAMAIPGLFARSKKGWTLAYYATLVGGVQNIVTFNIGGLLIGTLLSLYLLFQIREYYK